MTRKLSPEEIRAERKRLGIDQQVQQATASVGQRQFDERGADAGTVSALELTNLNRQYR